MGPGPVLGSSAPLLLLPEQEWAEPCSRSWYRMTSMDQCREKSFRLSVQALIYCPKVLLWQLQVLWDVMLCSVKASHNS